MKRLNTTAAYWDKHDDVNSLEGTHDIPLGGGPPSGLAETASDHPWYADRAYDPFRGSGLASYCYERGDLLPVAQHNLTDIHRTWELAELVRTFVPSKDITTKKL